MMDRKRVTYLLGFYIIYLSVNLAFVYKYVSRISSHASLISLGYIGLLSLSAVVFHVRKSRWKNFWKKEYYIFSVVLITVLLSTLLQLSPSITRVGRAPAIQEFIQRLLAGEFPYGGTSKPSGFPILFILAYPFYAMGDVGYIQIFSFVLFSFLLFKNTHSIPNESKIFILILFASAPAFLYEVAVRSELVSNMILVLGMIFLFEKWRHPSRGLERRLGAFLIGLSLSTRAIALLPFTIYLAHLWRNREERNQLLVDVLFAVFAFLLTILPILLWNVSSFLEAGPLSLQNSYLPLSVVIALMIASILMGWRARNLLQVLSGSAILLFVAGVAYIAIQIPSLLDLPEQIRSSQVDISYLIFSLPFLLIIFGRMLHLNNAPEVQTISSPSTGKENE